MRNYNRQRITHLLTLSTPRSKPLSIHAASIHSLPTVQDNYYDTIPGSITAILDKKFA